MQSNLKLYNGLNNFMMLCWAILSFPQLHAGCGLWVGQACWFTSEYFMWFSLAKEMSATVFRREFLNLKLCSLIQPGGTGRAEGWRTFFLCTSHDIFWPLYSPTWGHVYLGPAALSIAGEAGEVCHKSELEGGVGLAGLSRKEWERRHPPPGQHL